MTRKERALKNLKQMCSDGRYLGSGSHVPLEVLEDFEVAIKALEQEPRKGHWIDTGWINECSCCHEKSFPFDDCGYGSIYHNFCPNCGADMREVEE